MAFPESHDNVTQHQHEAGHVSAAQMGLPDAPPSIGKEESLYHAPVVAYSLQGHALHGLLHKYDVWAKHIVLVDQNQHQVVVEFSKIRFLIFGRPLLPSDQEAHQQKVEAAIPHAPKAFELVFNDGKKFHATAETIITMTDGLHLFLDKPDHHIYRVFIPKETIKAHNFDTRFNKGLIEHKEVAEQHEAKPPAAPQAPAPAPAPTPEQPTAQFEPEPAPVHTETQVQPEPEPAPVHTETQVQPEPQPEPPTQPEAEAQPVVKKKTPQLRQAPVSLTPIHHAPAHQPRIATDVESLQEILENKWPLPTEHLGELLVLRHIIEEEDLYNVLIEQSHRPGDFFGEVLLTMELASEKEVFSTLAYKLGLPFVDLENFDIDPTALNLFPQELATKHHLLPLCIYDGRLVMALSDPTNTDISKMAEFITEHRLELVVATMGDLEKAIDKHYGKQEDNEVFEHLEEIDLEYEEPEEGDLKEAERLSQEKPIVRLVQNMIVDAIRQKTSDIHIRPAEHHVDLIYRIDGTLVKMRRFSKSVHQAVISRIKIIGRMDISERRVPQDGRARFVLHNNPVDMRISIMPTVSGESVVIRILDTSSGLKNLNELGFGSRDYSKLKEMLSMSYGILLVTGPTGSGKSTTLYAGLKDVMQTNVNIITAEDPVEYHIDGIEQMQVNSKVGYTFARILRNILRHDPDVIMVGEIRDQETAKIAIESALTGHLVLSTLHTNSASVTVTRLLEMGVEPYLINDTLLGVLAQRLIRLNCPYCIAEEEVDPEVLDTLNVSADEKFYRGAGCDQCNGSGYHGRKAVYELLSMNQEIRHLVSSGADAEQIHQAALQEGMTPLTQNALNAARQQKTSLAEVYRVRLN